MRILLLGSLFIGMSVVHVFAAPPSPNASVRGMVHPSTSVAVFHPQTAGEIYRPSTTVETFRPTTQTGTFHPQTNVSVARPTTQVQTFHPQTEVATFHPQTTVEVYHPQTTVTVFHPQTPQESFSQGVANVGGENRNFSSSSRVQTSMSDFKPMQAKDFSAVKQPEEKAAALGGGSLNLGNEVNVAEKDNANKSSLLGAQRETQSVDIDPKKTNLDGLEKLLSDRAKFQEKK